MWRKRKTVYFLAVSIMLLIVWTLSGLLPEEWATMHHQDLGDGGQRCSAVLRQLKWIKTHPKDKAS